MLILAACLLAGVAGAQMAPGMQGMPKEGQAGKGMMSDGKMMKECQAMVAEREDVAAREKAMDTTLDNLVGRMDAADKDHRIEATGAVVRELVSQRKAMRKMNTKMESRMKGHMMEHMRSGMMESMANCPMMKEMAAGAPKPVTTGKDDHVGHH